jgi:hypothetical protein
MEACDAHEVQASVLQQDVANLTEDPLSSHFKNSKEFGPTITSLLGDFDVATRCRDMNRRSLAMSGYNNYAMAFLCSVFKDSVCHSFEATRTTITHIVSCYQHSFFGNQCCFVLIFRSDKKHLIIHQHIKSKTFFVISGGPKWTRTIDLTLIRRAL